MHTRRHPSPLPPNPYRTAAGSPLPPDPAGQGRGSPLPPDPRLATLGSRPADVNGVTPGETAIAPEQVR